MSGEADPGWRLFVYGTLRREAAPRVLRPHLARARRMGGGRLPGRLYDLGDYPGAVPDEGCGAWVVGEVLTLPPDPALLARLDHYEDGDFRRVVRRVWLDDGSSCPCWVYAYVRDPGEAPRVEGGDALERR